MENSPLAGVSPAPKHGPQKHSRRIAPAVIRSAARPLFISADRMGPAFYKCRQDGHRARIEVQAERAVSDAFAAKQARCSTEVVIGPSGTPGDLALIRPDASVPDLAQQVHSDALELPVRIQLCLMQDVLCIFLQLMNAVDLRRMHGQRDGAFDARQIDPHAAVIPGHLPRRHLLPGLRPPVLLIPALRLLIRRPDRRPAGRLCGHDVNGAAVLRGKTASCGPTPGFSAPVRYTATTPGRGRS